MVTLDMVQSRLKAVWNEYNFNRARAGKNPVGVREVSRATGLAVSTLSLLANNRVDMIHFKTISALCVYFGCKPGDLFVFTPDDESTPSAL